MTDDEGQNEKEKGRDKTKLISSNWNIKGRRTNTGT